MLLKAFAVARKISERTARNYRAKGRSEWIAFLRERGVSVPEPPRAVQMTDLQKARAAADEAYKLLARVQRDAAAESDPTARAVLARGVRDARRAWEDARRDAERLEESAGQVVPVATVRKVLVEGVLPLGAAMRTFANNVAGDLPQEWRPAFFAAARKEHVRWNASIESLNKGVEALLSGC